MDDLISRQAAIEAILGQPPEPHYPSWYAEQIKQLPPAQPEIIRCKDCQHSEYDAVYGDRYCHHNGKAEIVPDNHYCGYGERRTDE